MNVTQISLIEAIECHPSLWDISHPQHGDHLMKERVWTEIAASITPGWEDMRPAQQQETIKVFMKRWKSLRDRTRRDLTEQQMSERSGAPAPKRKAHVYAVNLDFVRQAMIRSSRITTSNIAAISNSPSASAGREDPLVLGTPSPSVLDSAGPPSPQGSEVAGVVEESIVSQQPGEMETHDSDVRGSASRARAVRGPGRGRGRGRGQQPQPVGPQCEEGVLALLGQVQHERRSLDPFLDPKDRRASFCRYLYHVLEDMGTNELECVDRINEVCAQMRRQSLHERLPYTPSQEPPMAPSTSALVGHPSHFHPPPQQLPLHVGPQQPSPTMGHHQPPPTMPHAPFLSAQGYVEHPPQPFPKHQPQSFPPPPPLHNQPIPILPSPHISICN